MPKRSQPTNAEVLDVIIPVLVQSKKEGKPTLEATPLAVDAVLERWPQIGLKAARAKVTRLRIL